MVQHLPHYNSMGQEAGYFAYNVARDAPDESGSTQHRVISLMSAAKVQCVSVFGGRGKKKPDCHADRRQAGEKPLRRVCVCLTDWQFLFFKNSSFDEFL